MLAIHYRKLILLFLFAGVAWAQKPKAPFTNPNDPDDPAMKLEYKGELTVPKNGQVTIPFFPPFRREPSCSFKGGTLPGVKARVTNYYAILKAKPGKHMKYDCVGIKKEDK